MLRRIIPLVVLAGVISLAAIACGGDAEVTPTPPRASPPPPPPAPTALPTVAPTSPSAPTPGGTTVTVVNRDLGGSGEYRFDPEGFDFSVGETVTFSISAETEFHTFTAEDLDIDVEIDGGTTETFSFTFNQAGTFKLICIPHESLGMTGTITVQ